MHGEFPPQSRWHWLLRLTLLSDLDKHLGDLYPSIIGTSTIVNDEIGNHLKDEERPRIGNHT